MNAPRFALYVRMSFCAKEIFTYCQNLNCPARLKESLIHFASKDALNIQGLGDKVIEQLFEKKLIFNALDLYALKLERFNAARQI